ncbi:hypothetical protein CDD81_7007 [Ophiocordyceps australis]|uniref:Uncharacterized protein n=1 Tax=Ophiocordyceps australis TaxID=1399860 RepID=A0A2C5YGW3_9HYPO|nr:hypothetical protein CDD81_7007 [Ophiocordyceps australis]
MAPGVVDVVEVWPQVSKTGTQHDGSGPTLYQGLKETELWEKADKHILSYGTAFHKDMITGARGVYLYSASGRRILDWTSGQMSCLLGHGNQEVVEVIESHARDLDHLFSGMLSPPVVSLAERLCKALPEGLDRAFFLSTGGESNEAAMKLAKVVTGKFEVVGVAASWHGMTAQAQSAQFHYGRKGHGPLVPGSLMLPAPNAYRSVFRHGDGSYDWEAELDYGWRMVDLQSCGSLAACIVECVQSSGGMHVLPEGYLAALKRHCEARGMLLIVDEAQTGMGRCGELVAVQSHGVVPDILTLSKTLGNGLPLSAVVTSEALGRAAQDAGFFFYTTHVNDPLPAAVGDRVVHIVLRDGLVAHARAMGLLLHTGLRRLAARYACIGDVRGCGLMAGMEIVADPVSKLPAMHLAQRVADRAYQLGVWANLGNHATFGGVFRIAPPLTITAQEIHHGLAIFERAFAETHGTLPLYQMSASPADAHHA